jgi:hypothetical protein
MGLSLLIVGLHGHDLVRPRSWIDYRQSFRSLNEPFIVFTP